MTGEETRKRRVWLMISTVSAASRMASRRTIKLSLDRRSLIRYNFSECRQNDKYYLHSEKEIGHDLYP